MPLQCWPVLEYDNSLRRFKLNLFKHHSQKRAAKLLHQEVENRIRLLDLQNKRITKEEHQKIYGEFYEWLSSLKGYGLWCSDGSSISSINDAIDTIDSCIELAKENYQFYESELRDKSEHGLGYEIKDMDEGYAATLNEEELEDAQRYLDYRKDRHQTNISNAKATIKLSLQMYVEATTLKNLYQHDSSDLLISDMYGLLYFVYVGDEYTSESSSIISVTNLDCMVDELRDSIQPINFYFPQSIIDKSIQKFKLNASRFPHHENPLFKSALFGYVPHGLEKLYKGIKLMKANIDIAEVSGYSKEIEILSKANV